ncbi:MAG: hypothetical protein OP8BY_1679 [Candidatus Saccharicenans subterraneus]|uniref:Uncharacterized protein n=1 Tax=Candidatus Saccharicenans subterraneus TaxID=2508984 RepID=A0A3E2BP74_9BACT|nr:MAG: hypothetical protein OP8BY_1679 [Candidatus Saccharicenans subterraneum]
MKNVLPLPRKEPEEEKQAEQKAKIIKFPEIQVTETAEPGSSKRPRVKITTHYLYYRDKKIPISRFEKAGYGKLLRLLVKEIS